MTIFTKIINRELPADIVYEDEFCIAIRDIHPQAPTHILLIPKKEIPTMNDVTLADQALLGHLLLTAPKIAKKEGLSEKGYRLAFNTNAHGGQTVFHIHLHIIGGTQLGSPAGT